MCHVVRDSSFFKKEDLLFQKMNYIISIGLDYIELTVSDQQKRVFRLMENLKTEIIGILIDSENKNISEIRFQKTEKDFSKLLFGQSLITFPYDENHEIILNRDLFYSYGKFFFAISQEENPELYSGNGIIVSYNSKDWFSHHLNIEEVKNRIRFFELIDGDAQEIIKN